MVLSQTLEKVRIIGLYEYRIARSICNFLFLSVLPVYSNASSLILFKHEVSQMGTADAEIKDPSVENPGLKCSPSLKSRVGQNIALHASPTAKNFSLAHFYRLGPFTFIFSQSLLEFFLCQLWLRHVPVWVNKIKWVTLVTVTDD